MSRDIKRDMYDYLPQYYHEIREAVNNIDVESGEVERLVALINDVLDQCYIDTATWGLEYWEQLCGITPVAGRSTGSRRDNVKAKLRGAGTVTKQTIKSIADAYYLSRVTEDNENYEINVKIVGRRGEPKNTVDIAESINRVIPAHIALTFEYTYLTWNELAQADVVWDDIEGETWNDFIDTAFIIEED